MSGGFAMVLDEDDSFKNKISNSEVSLMHNRVILDSKIGYPNHDAY